MSAESWTIIGTGIALAALIVTMLRALRADVTKQLDEVRRACARSTTAYATRASAWRSSRGCSKASAKP